MKAGIASLCFNIDKLVFFYSQMVEVTKQQQLSKTLVSKNLPKAIIIGVVKGGSTSLFRYLEQHPYMVASYQKEVHFFDLNYHKGLNWYSCKFPFNQSLRRGIEESKLVNFEASPSYIFLPHALNRIAKHLPQVKLILLLRNPVDRAYSHYQIINKMGKDKLSFPEAIDKEVERLANIREEMDLDEQYVTNPKYRKSTFKYRSYSYQARGRYIEQIKPLFNLFPREQVLILKSENLFTNTPMVLQEVFNFLDLPNWEIKCDRIYNRGKYKQEMPRYVRKKLVAYFRPYNEQLYEYLGRDFGWN